MKKNGFTIIGMLILIILVIVFLIIVLPKRPKNKTIENKEKIETIENKETKETLRNNISEKLAIEDAYLYIDAISKKYVMSIYLNEEINLDGKLKIIDGKLENIELEINHSKPTSGYLIYENHKLILGCLVINGYNIKYSNDIFEIDKNECETK